VRAASSDCNSGLLPRSPDWQACEPDPLVRVIDRGDMINPETRELTTLCRHRWNWQNHADRIGTCPIAPQIEKRRNRLDAGTAQVDEIKAEEKSSGNPANDQSGAGDDWMR
jgi:hypothetical protein